MAKYVSINKVKEVFGADDTQLLVGMGLVKAGNGSVALLCKNGEWEKAPISAEEKVLAYLKKKLTPAVPTTPAPKTDVYNTQRIGIYHDGGREGRTFYSAKVWVDILSREVDRELAYSIIKGVYKHLFLTKLNKEQKQALWLLIKKIPSPSWRERLGRTIA